MKGSKLSAARADTPAAAASTGGTPHWRAPRTAYVMNDYSGTVTPISTRTDTAGPAIPVGQGPLAIAITPGAFVGRAPVIPPALASLSFRNSIAPSQAWL